MFCIKSTKKLIEIPIRPGTQFSIALVLIGLSIATVPVKADLVTGWNPGERAPDFDAFYLDQGVQTATTWFEESGADVYVVSTCAMWCTPCQFFAEQSLAMTQSMAAEGIIVEFYDFIFQDSSLLEPDASDAQAWIDVAWSSDPQNVWFGGDIPLSASESVTNDIFNAIISSGGSGQAIPGIVVMDRNFVVQDLQEGFSRSHIEDSIRLAAVPEPGSSLLLLVAMTVFFAQRSRRIYQ